MPLTELLTLARAILRETGELPTAGNSPTAAVGPAGVPGALLTPGQTRGPLPKEQKKFYKLGTPVPPPAPVPTHAPVPTPPASESVPTPAPAAGSTEEAEWVQPTPAPPAGTTSGDEWAEAPSGIPPSTSAERGGRRPRPSGVAERTAGKRRSFTQGQRNFFLFLSILFTGAAFALGLGLNWFLQPVAPTAPKGTGSPGPAQASSPLSNSRDVMAMANNPGEADLRALDMINEALEARQARDFPRATALFERAGQASARLPGITYQLAEMALRRGDAIEASTLADRSQELGECVDQAYALRAVLAQRAGKSARALELLVAASRVNPYESRYFLYQAQLLRQLGKLQEAVGRLRAALARAEEPAQMESIGLFLRLTQLELGQEAEFNDELAAKLAGPASPPDWLVTAAARDLQHGRYAEGAAALRRALAGQSRPFVLLRLNDVFFRRYANRPELAPLYAQMQPAAATAAPLINPAPPAAGTAPAASPAPAASGATEQSLFMPMSPEAPAVVPPSPEPAPATGKPR